MDEREIYDQPYLIAYVPISDEFINLKKIFITCREHTIGRGLDNSTIIPVLTISRNHCKLKRMKNMEWYLFDFSTCGVEINGVKVGKGSNRRLTNGDIIKIEPLNKFTYKFVIPPIDEYNVPSKRIKLEDKPSNTDIINNVKVKFEQSQNYERSQIQKKMENAKQMITKSMLLKQQLESDMNQKIQQLENDYAAQIENLTGAKNLVEQKTDLLIKERDVQLAAIQKEMGSKIAELMEQIKKHNENEIILNKENSFLKEKLEHERQSFMAELLRESSSKQDMLDQLEKKIQEQEIIRKKEKEELENMHKKENEQLRLAMEKELKELEEKKRQREDELKKELDSIKRNLAEQVKQTEQQELKAKQELIEKLQQLQQLSDIEKHKVKQLEKEKKVMEEKHKEVQSEAKKSITDLMDRVKERENELAVLTVEKTQKQLDPSGKLIENLQQELEMANNKLRDNDTTITKEVYIIDPEETANTKELVLNEVGNIMENEFQCSICSELFIEATTLGCSHTFCAFCIKLWKQKKKDCPICRTPLTAECRSLVLDSFIEKMVQNLTEEMKVKRQEMLRARKEDAKRSGAGKNRSNRKSVNNPEGRNFERTARQREREPQSEENESDSETFGLDDFDESSDDELSWYGDNYRQSETSDVTDNFTGSDSDDDSWLDEFDDES